MSAIAGGALRSEGPGAPHRYRALLIADVGLAVLVLAIVVSYSGVFGQPAPNHLPIAVSDNPTEIVQLEQHDGLDLTVVRDAAAVRTSVLERDTVGGIVLPGTSVVVSTIIASGAGKTTALGVTRIGATLAAGHIGTGMQRD